MYRVTCWRSFLIRQYIEYRVASMVWRCQLGLAPTCLIDLVDLYRVLEVVALCAHRRGGCSQSRLPVTLSCRTSLVLLWPRRYGMASLLRYASYLGHFHTHSIINLKLFFLIVLESGAPLSSFLEEVLYKYWNERIKER